MKQAILYTRFSPRPNAQDCESCEGQEARCRAYCKQLGHDIIGCYADKAVTGGSLSRPGLDKAISALQPGAVLVVDRNDRLARDMLVNLTIRHQVNRRQATIEYADGSPVDTTPEGELFQNILAAFAAYERARIRAKLKQWAAKKQAKGEWIGRPPIGWRLDPDNPTQLIENVAERQAITRACELKLDGNPSHRIAEILNDEHGLCRGKPWSDRTIRRLVAKYAV